MLLLLVAKAKIWAVKVDTSLDRPICLVNLSALFSARYYCCSCRSVFFAK